jgi:serine/threonine protein kinase
MFQVGQKIAHFEILKKIGEGGMGEVYLVQDAKLHRKAAMKVQHLEEFEVKERRDRFAREAQTAAQVNHPNVMGIYDIGFATGDDGKEFSYIVMEYLPGRSLSEVMRGSEYDLGDMVRIAEKIASGLAAAHRLNIVHRDIKADNIIIDEQGEPKILDFGLAKASSTIEFEGEERSTKTVSQELTKAGKILGTVSYMSPEQARGEKVDVRSDVFSFGILLYKMMTGELPFDGPTQVSTLAKILESQHAQPSLKNQNIPPELERIIDKCLQKDPSDRYQGAMDLTVDLRHVRKLFDSGITDTVTSISGERARQLAGKSKSQFNGKQKIGVAAAAILILALFGYFGSSLFSIGGGSSAVQAQENSLAILGFENKTGDDAYDWLKTGLPEILLTDLSQTPSLKVISHERILDCFPDRKAAHTHEQCAKAAQSLGASKLLSGSFYRLGDQIRIDARLEDVATGTIILAEKVIGADAFSLVDSLTVKLASSLNIKNIEGMGNVALYTSSSEEAYKHYLTGLEQFLEQRWDEARESFNRAIEIDSTFAMPYLRIGMTYIFEGRTVQGKQFFEKAKKYENRLPQRDRNLLDIYVDLWLDKEFNDAFTKMEVFVNNHPEDKEGRAVYGLLIWSFQKDSTRAFAQIDTALQLDPFFLLAQMFQISIARQSNNIPKVVETALKIKKYYPESPLAYDELATVYKLQGKYQNAIGELQQLYSSFPTQKGNLLEISRLFILLGDFDSAGTYLSKFKKAAGNDEFDLVGYYDAMANLQVWRGELKNSLKSIKLAAEFSTKTGDSEVVRWRHELVCRYFERIGRVDSALYYAEKSNRWATAFSKVGYPMILLDLDYSRRQEARKMFERVLPELRSKMPADFQPLVDDLDRLFEATYDADTARIISVLDTIIVRQKNPPTSQNCFILAMMNAEFRNYGRARELFLPFVEGNERSSSGFIYILAQYYLGLANEGLNRKEDAITNYSEVLKYWKNADIETKELKDARERLARLSA